MQTYVSIHLSLHLRLPAPFVIPDKLNIDKLWVYNIDAIVEYLLKITYLRQDLRKRISSYKLYYGCLLQQARFYLKLPNNLCGIQSELFRSKIDFSSSPIGNNVNRQSKVRHVNTYHKTL